MTPEWALPLQHAFIIFFNYLFKAVTAFLQYDSPLYWPFLVSTLVIGAVAWRIASSGASWREFRHRYFGRALWWHPSARVDYVYYVVNAVFFPVVVGPALFTGAMISGWLDYVLAPWIGPFAPTGEAGFALRVIYTVVSFIAYDLGRFVAHSAQHDIPFLFEFHKVHHSAEVLTPFTAFRSHPVDLALMAWSAALLTGLATWGFQRITGESISYYTFLQLQVLLWVFSLTDNLKHWQVWISYGPFLNRWLISPAQHQLHHSAEVRHFGINRGFEIALWDRLYGTLVLPIRGETFRMGLGDGTDGRWHSIARIYFWPFGLVWRRLLRRPEDEMKD